MSADPVAFLAAALTRAEETAKAATEGPWHANPYDSDWDVCNFEASIGTRPADGKWPDAATDVVGHGYEGGGVCELPDAVHIAAFSPDVVLRRVAADRQILAEHANDYGDCTSCGRPSEETNSRGHAFFTAVDWPCRTVLLLAQAWGWEDEQRG